jgi:hypothetical protein
MTGTHPKTPVSAMPASAPTGRSGSAAPADAIGGRAARRHLHLTLKLRKTRGALGQMAQNLLFLPKILPSPFLPDEGRRDAPRRAAKPAMVATRTIPIALPKKLCETLGACSTGQVGRRHTPIAVALANARVRRINESGQRVQGRKRRAQHPHAAWLLVSKSPKAALRDV